MTTSTWASTRAARRSTGSPLDGLGLGGGRGRLEVGRGPIDDREEDVLLRRDVGVQAGALDVEGLGDVADARRRVAVRVEQLAGHLVDLAPPRTGLDHRRSYLTIVRSS